MDLTGSGEPVEKKPNLAQDPVLPNFGAAAAAKPATSTSQANASSEGASSSTASNIKVEPGTGTATPTPAPLALLNIDQSRNRLTTVIFEIIRSIKKDTDTTARPATTQVTNRVLEVEKVFAATRETVKQLRGIDRNKEEQLEQLEQLRKQLQMKIDLIRKYKNKEF